MNKLIMLSLYSLFTFHFSLSTLKAQGTWTPRTPFPDSAYVQGISGFSIGNYGYVGLGSAQNVSISFDYFWQFNASTDTWTRKASFPGAARVSPASFVIGRKAYIVTGSVKNGGACVNECWEYDTATDAWTRKADFPGSARVYAVGFAIDSLGYVGTGAYELADFRKDFYAYHPSTDTWTRIADFGGIARDAANGFGVNGKGYVCFGKDSTDNSHNDIWEYDPVSNIWAQKSNCPGPGLEVAIGFTVCDNIYVGSGDTTDYFHSDDHDKFWKYNTIYDSWTQETNAPSPPRFQGAAFAIGDSGYYGLGMDSSGLVHTIFDKFYAGDSCTNITTGNGTVSNNVDIIIYPNPNNGIFTVAFISDLPLGGEESPLIIEVYNLLGENVLTETLHNTQGDNIINMRNQPSAVYLYRVTNQNGNLLYSGKFIIQ